MFYLCSRVRAAFKSKEIPSTMSKSKSQFLSLLRISVTSSRYERSGLYLEVINNLIGH